MKSEEKIGSKIKFFLGRYKYSSIDQKIKKLLRSVKTISHKKESIKRL